MAKTKWPTEVPILEAKDMCIGPLRSGSCGCLAYWESRIFNYGESTKSPTRAALLKAEDELGIETETNRFRRWYGIPRTFATGIGDTGTISRAQVARVWNRAMAILGYVVGNPECDKNGKLKPVKKSA